MEAGAATEERFTEEEHAFLLSRVQPALIGLIDGSLSTLAPIFAVALSTKDPHIAFFAGLATAIGAAVSMGFSEALSDTGEFTGRGNPGSAARSRRRHVHRRRLPHAAVPARPLPRGDHRGDRHGGDRARGASGDPRALLPDRLPALVRHRHPRRGDHRAWPRPRQRARPSTVRNMSHRHEVR